MTKFFVINRPAPRVRGGYSPTPGRPKPHAPASPPLPMTAKALRDALPVSLTSRISKRLLLHLSHTSHNDDKPDWPTSRGEASWRVGEDKVCDACSTKMVYEHDLRVTETNGRALRRRIAFCENLNCLKVHGYTAWERESAPSIHRHRRLFS